MAWIDDLCDDNPLLKVVLVAYNGKAFDVPFLFAAWNNHNVTISERLQFQFDPLDVVRKLQFNSSPNNWTLSTIYQYITGEELQDAHSASANVGALKKVFQYTGVWKERYSQRKFIPLKSNSVSLLPETTDDLELDENPTVDDLINEGAVITDPEPLSHPKTIQIDQLHQDNEKDDDESAEADQQQVASEEEAAIFQEGLIKNKAFKSVDSTSEYQKKRKQPIPSPPRTRKSTPAPASTAADTVIFEPEPPKREGLQLKPDSVNSPP